MTYVGFRFPGNHSIHARLVWPLFPGSKGLRKMNGWFLERQNRRSYENTVLNYERTELKYHACVAESAYDLSASEPLDVVVDAGHFAKEPPEWLKTWVNLPYSIPPVDQCAFKKRAIAAFTIQPPIWLLFWTVIGFVYAFVCIATLIFCGLFLARGTNLKAIWKFDGPAGIWPRVKIVRRFDRDGNHRSLWIWEDQHGQIKVYRALISPFGFLVYLGILQYLHLEWEVGYLELVLLALSKSVTMLGVVLGLLLQFGLTLVATVAIGAIVSSALGYFLFRWASHAVQQRKAYEATPEYRERMKKEAEERRKEYLESAYRYLTCPTVAQAPVAATVKALPPKRRTLRLRFHELKREVCRPYAS